MLRLVIDTIGHLLLLPILMFANSSLVADDLLPAIKLDSDLILKARCFIYKEIINSRKLKQQQSDSTHRGTINYGYDYSKLIDNDKTLVPIPQVLQEILAQALTALKEKYRLSFSSIDQFTNVIVSVYGPGDRLEPHIDVDESKKNTQGKSVNFYFGEEIVGVIITADSEGKLFFMNSDSKPVFREELAQKVQEEDGSVVLLQGQLRRAPYYHGVSPVKRERISITYRSVVWP